MKLMDEVKLESSVEALESILGAFNGSPYWPAIRQNLQALREVLAGTTQGMCEACRGTGDLNRGQWYPTRCPHCKGTAGAEEKND
jgi:hypothetical protein